MTVGPWPIATVQRVSYTAIWGMKILLAIRWRSVRFLGGFYGKRPEARDETFGMRRDVSACGWTIFGSWLNEFPRPITQRRKTGLDASSRFRTTADFIGRKAAEHERANGLPNAHYAPSRWTRLDAMWLA